MIIGAYHQAYKNRNATFHAVESFRNFYPDTPYHLCSDNGFDFQDIAETFNCSYKHYDDRIGYDPKWGFGVSGAKKWLKRFHSALLNMECDYIVMMEDDVLIQNYIDLPEGDIFVHNNKGNVIRKEFRDYFSEKYSVTFFDEWYGAGGGSIFKRDTFIKNYDRIMDIFEIEMQKVFDLKMNRGIGWPDHFMTLFYTMCGKRQVPLSSLTEANKNSDWSNPKYSIVHQFKKYYV